MSKGDTTVHIDFEVGGASAAKMTVMDVYRAQQANSSKLNEAARALSKEQGVSFSDAKKAIREYVNQTNKAANEIAAANKAADAKATAAAAATAKKEESIEKERARKEEKIRDEERRSQRRATELAVADAKWEAREKLKESKRVARDKARDLKMQESQRGAMGSLMGRGLWGAAMGVAGYAGVAGVSNVLSSIGEGLQNFINKRKELEDAITPIVALEDNVSRMGAIREEVVSTAVALGRSYQEVGQFYSDLVGSTGNLANGERLSLIKETKELAQLTGGSLVTAQNLLTKSYQIYGKELTNVNQLQNKLMYTQDQGSITFEDMGLRLPELLQTGKFAGMNIDEVLGTVIGATRKSGSIEKTMTGMRNFFLIMEEAQKKGVILTGTYREKLGQLAEMFQLNKPQMQELFGKEVVVHASAITDAIGEVGTAIGELGKIAGEADAVFDKLLKKANDPAFRQMQTFNMYDQVSQNAANIGSNLGVIDTPMLRMLEAGEAGAAHANVATGGRLSPWMAKLIGYSGAALIPGYADEGRALAQNQMDMPDFIASKRVDFFRKKEADMEYLNDVTHNGEWYKTPENIAKRQEIEGRTLDPFLMTAEEKRIYRETGATPQSAEVTSATSVGAGSGDAKSHQLLESIDGWLAQIAGDKSTQVAKPGGGTTNNQETL